MDAIREGKVRSFNAMKNIHLTTIEANGILAQSGFAIHTNAAMNQSAALKIILFSSNPVFSTFVNEEYTFIRGMNPVHFVMEKGFAIGSGEEPVLGTKQDRLRGAGELILYFAFLKGAGWAGQKLATLKPLTGEAATIAQRKAAQEAADEIITLARKYGIGVPRTGKAGSGSTIDEVAIDSLQPIHDVPRAGKPDGYIEDLARDIRMNGYDLSKPVSATRLPDGSLIVTGGHHRIEAMRYLGETTVPLRVYDAATSDPVLVARMLGIGRITGKYTGTYAPKLTPEQQSQVNIYLQQWKEQNGF